MKKIRLIALLMTALALTAQPAFADGKTSLTTSVHSKVLNGYTRTKGSDGKFKPEYYALSNGGAISGTMRDSSMEKVDFPHLSGVLGQFLAQQNYHLARDSKSAELLLLVNWGHTTPRLDENYSATMNDLSSAMIADRALAIEAAKSEDKPGNPFEGGPRGAATEAFENALVDLKMFRRMREQADEANARLLGYIDDLNLVNDRVPKAGDERYFELIGDIEEPRYYVILTAYDFRELVRHGRQKLLWSTRVSIRAPGNAFDKDFAAMLAKAAKLFGQDSGGLLRRYDPKGRVDIGDIEVIGMSSGSGPESSK